jgi:hypothetical protein
MTNVRKTVAHITALGFEHFVFKFVGPVVKLFDDLAHAVHLEGSR